MAKRASRILRQGGDKAPLERLRTFGDPTLKQVTTPVLEFDSRLKNLAETMVEIMEREEGVGLAAPQIGSVSRVMVWKQPDEEGEYHVFVNPQIVERSEACCTESEGCLSVPGATVEVTRAEEIVVEAQGLAGERFRVELSSLPARIVQHEIDHLEGLLILDRTSPEERKRVLREMRERALDV